MTDVTYGGSVDWAPAAPGHFTGDVWAASMSEPSDVDGVRVLGVQFSPGARSDWHSHPGGQVLHVVFGRGVVKNSDGVRVEVEAGDTVTTPPDELHWHGAAATSPMMHLSITSRGQTVWTGDKVSDREYEAD